MAPNPPPPPSKLSPSVPQHLRIRTDSNSTRIGKAQVRGCDPVETIRLTAPTPQRPTRSRPLTHARTLLNHGRKLWIDSSPPVSLINVSRAQFSSSSNSHSPPPSHIFLIARKFSSHGAPLFYFTFGRQTRKRKKRNTCCVQNKTLTFCPLKIFKKNKNE